MMAPVKGRVYAEYWVGCGRCSDSRVLCSTQKKDTHSAAKALGWKKTLKYGWLCSSCIHILSITPNA